MLIMGVCGFAANTCRSYFEDSRPPYPFISLLEKRTHIRWNRDKPPSLHTSKFKDPMNRYRADLLFKLGRFIGDVGRRYTRQNKKHTYQEAIQYGQFFLDLARQHFDANRVQYVVKKRKFHQKMVSYLEILPNNKSTFNKEALFVFEESGIRLVYDPVELLNFIARALVYDNKFYLSSMMVAELNLLKDETANHEQTHALTDKKFRERTRYPFYGRADSYHQSLPSSPVLDGYHKSYAFDEVNAFYSSVKKGLEELIFYLKSSNELSPSHVNYYFKNYKKDIRYALHVARRTRIISKTAIEAVRQAPEAITWTMSEGAPLARWKQQNPLAPNFYYTVELPIVQSLKYLSKEQRADLVIREMKITSLAAKYFQNLFNLANYATHRASQTTDRQEQILILETLNAHLFRQLNFGENSKVPTQKEVLESFQAELEDLL